MSPYEEFRRLIRDLNLQAQRDLQIIWQSVGGDPAALAEVLAEVVQTYGSASASVAADWYDQLRVNEGVRPGFTAVIPDPASPGTTQLVEWALAKATTEDTFRSMITGGVQRRITNYSRDVITTSSVQDPRARGWMRTGTGECGFCAMLVSRGAVYTKSTVDFASHDHCKCSAAPAWSPEQTQAVKAEFVPSARRRSEDTKQSDRDRAKAWINANL